MAEILLLPIRSQGLDQMARLSADLAAAYARGEDLGSRVPHIQAGGGRLREPGRALEGAIDALDLTLNRLGLQDQVAGAALQQLLGTIQELADATQRVPVDV